MTRSPAAVFTPRELDYVLGERRLARVATVSRTCTPHVTPVGWRYNAALGTIDITGIEFERTKKYRDVRATGRAALVIDDVVPSRAPRGVEIRGRAEALSDPQPLIRIYPERVVSWGIESGPIGERRSRRIDRASGAQAARRRVDSRPACENSLR